MPRRCLCSRLMEALRADPRLATLPLACRMVFLLLAEAAAETQETGWIPFVEPRRIGLLIRCTETEAETHLGTLIAEGLIRAERGGLAVPMVQAAADRAALARRNGAAGGRPRKGETRETYLARRQQEMLLAMPGGKTRETQAETEPAKPASRGTTTTYEEDERKKGSGTGQVVSRAREAETREPPGWVALGGELAELARLDPARGGYDYRPVQGWLTAGRSAEAIRAAVARVVERPSYDPRQVRSLRYFEQAVLEQPEPERPAAPLTAEQRAAERAEAEAIERWAEAVAAGRNPPLPASLAAAQAKRDAERGRAAA